MKAVDQAEALRGFKPPLWIDIRISRSVRSAGFRGKEFADLLKTRYLWMPELGNKRKKQRRKGIEIQNPAAAKGLLERALENRKRRIMFFCACRDPFSCHRYQIGKLVLTYAKAQKARVEVVEWPGGQAGTFTIDVSPATLRKIDRDAVKSLSIPASMTLSAAALLPWGTIGTLQAGTEKAKVLMGPAFFNAAGSHLRIFPDEAGTRANSNSFRKQRGYAKIS